MRSFACAKCGQLLFFENSHCLRCGAMLGFIPEQLSLQVIEDTRNDGLRVLSQGTAVDSYKRCARSLLAACNWLVSEPEQELCVSCRLTAAAPELRRDDDLQAFAKAEAAKRRLIFQLLDLRLPYISRSEDPLSGLGFVFGFRSDATPIMTGHLDGLITLDLTECDNAHRERLRAAFGEPYRTLLGHFRHEIGHYFWNLLIADSDVISKFRKQFGDEQESYTDALERNYQQPLSFNWSDNYVSAYAASHPWEDWAETFAHYLHIRDTLQTAATFGLHVSPSAPAVAPLDGKLATRACEDVAQRDFASVIAEWLPLTYAFNAANRSMGKEDLYPFVLAKTVIDKLAFVHQVVRDTADTAVALREARLAAVAERAALEAAACEAALLAASVESKSDADASSRHEAMLCDGSLRDADSTHASDAGLLLEASVEADPARDTAARSGAVKTVSNDNASAA
jgi:hypothetical protein